MKKKIVKYILIFIVSIIFIYNITYQIFNFNFPYIVQDSMQEGIKKYDVLILTTKESYKISDIIVFKYNNQDRIAKIEDINQEIYKLKASSNLYYYENINKSDIIGKVDKVMKFIGILLVVVRSKIVTILLFLLFVIKFILNEKKIKSYKRKMKRSQ
jgi:hypothetical protein